jgi:hypothetical protein
VNTRRLIFHGACICRGVVFPLPYTFSPHFCVSWPVYASFYISSTCCWFYDSPRAIRMIGKTGKTCSQMQQFEILLERIDTCVSWRRHGRSSEILLEESVREYWEEGMIRFMRGQHSSVRNWGPRPRRLERGCACGDVSCGDMSTPLPGVRLFLPER